MTVVEFLLARIVEVEALARRAVEDNGFANGTWLVHGSDEVGYYIQDETRSGVGTDDAWLTEGEAYHIAFHDPNRVLAECEAKRRAIRELVDYAERCVWAVGVESALQALALPDADHPDYQSVTAPDAAG